MLAGSSLELPGAQLLDARRLVWSCPVLSTVLPRC
jgi:hypothetical protein